MTEEIAIVGVGGQGRECLGIAEAMAAAGHDLRVVGFFDDDPSPNNQAILADRGYRVLGPITEALSGKVSICLGIGDGHVRRILDALLVEHRISSPVLVHPDSTVGSQVLLEPGTVLFAGARLTNNIRLGRHVHVNQNVTVGHDCELEAYTTLNPQACISGSVHMEPEATVGAAAVVLQGLTVGAGAMVGAGACVTHPVPRQAVVVGVPARQLVRA